VLKRACACTQANARVYATQLVKQMFDESSAYFTDYDAFHAKVSSWRACECARALNRCCAQRLAVRAKMAEMQQRRNEKRRPEKAARAEKAKARAPALINFLKTPRTCACCAVCTQLHAMHAAPLLHLANPTLSGSDVLKMMTVFASVMSKPPPLRAVTKAELKVLEQMASAEPIDQ
jgi:hypothetical protein